MLAVMKEISSKLRQPFFNWATAHAHADQLEEARNQINELAALDFKISLDWTWASSVFSLGQVCADLSDRNSPRSIILDYNPSLARLE